MGRIGVIANRPGMANTAGRGLTGGIVRILGFLGVMGISGRIMRRWVNGFITHQTHSKGFTLIELMVTLAVAGILLTIAVPSFQEFIASNRISTEANG
jgi:prepilin-type N-terminal cleavage/methylation domain-containing protein